VRSERTEHEQSSTKEPGSMGFMAGREVSVWWRDLDTTERVAVGFALDAMEGVERFIDQRRPIACETRDRALEAARWIVEKGKATDMAVPIYKRIIDTLVSDYRHHYTSGNGVDLGDLSERQLARLVLNAEIFLRAHKGEDDYALMEEEVGGLRTTLLYARCGPAAHIVAP